MLTFFVLFFFFYTIPNLSRIQSQRRQEFPGACGFVSVQFWGGSSVIWSSYKETGEVRATRKDPKVFVRTCTQPARPRAHARAPHIQQVIVVEQRAFYWSNG